MLTRDMKELIRIFNEQGVSICWLGAMRLECMHNRARLKTLTCLSVRMPAMQMLSSEPYASLAHRSMD